MVIGSYGVSVDNKGRIFMPAKWRDSYADKLIAMRGLTLEAEERFLLIMPESHFNKFLDELNSPRAISMRLNNAARYILENAYECDINAKGRILIDKSLLDYAGITTNATLAAARNNCFEAWEPERLKEKNLAYTQLDSAHDLQALADELENAGK